MNFRMNWIYYLFLKIMCSITFNFWKIKCLIVSCSSGKCKACETETILPLVSFLFPLIFSPSHLSFLISLSYNSCSNLSQFLITSVDNCKYKIKIIYEYFFLNSVWFKLKKTHWVNKLFVYFWALFLEIVHTSLN